MDARERHAVTRLALVHQVPLEQHLDRARQLAGRRALGHLLERDHLVIHVLRHAVLDLQRVAILVLIGHRRARGRPVQAGVVAVILGRVPVCHLAVLRALDDLGAHQRALGDDALDTDQPVEQVRAQLARRHMVRAEVALDSDAELMHRHRLAEGGVLLHDHLAQRVLERGEVLPGVPHEVSRQLVVEGAQVVQVEHQPLFLPADHSMDLLHVPLLVEEVEEDALLLLILHSASEVSVLNKEGEKGHKLRAPPCTCR